MKTHLRRQVVIVGGGFAGLAASLRLANQPGFRRDFNVTLIDQNCYHLYHALLYEVATASFEVKEKDLEYLQGGVCIRLKSLGELVTKKQIDFIQSAVTGISTTEQLVRFQDSSELKFDHLVWAVGAEPNDFDIPGLRQHALTLNSISDALAIREKLRQLVAAVPADSTVNHVVIGGGGFTGVELAGELLEYIRRLTRHGEIPAGRLQLTITEAGTGLITALGTKVSTAAQRRLASLGAHFTFGSPIVEVKSNQVILGNGTVLPADTFIWTGGIRANSVISQLGLPVNKRGQLIVDQYLRVQSQSNIWAAGDCLFLIDPVTKRPVNQTAAAAVNAGQTVAENIVSSLQSQSLQPFVTKPTKFVIPIGGKYAVAAWPHLTFTHWPAWLVRKFMDLQYFLSIMNFKNAWRVFIRGAKVYLKND